MRKSDVCANGHKLTPENSRVRLDRRGCIECKTCSKAGVKKFRDLRPVYDVWKTMIRRCIDPTFKDWHLYGGKQPPVTVCERWLNSYDAFAADMGERPPGYLLDRKDGRLNYTPENCRWVTAKQSARNLSSNHLIQYAGETKSIAEWAEHAGLKYMTFFYRLQRGWSLERAITTPKIEEDVLFGLKRDPVTGRVLPKGS